MTSTAPVYRIEVRRFARGWRLHCPTLDITTEVLGPMPNPQFTAEVAGYRTIRGIGIDSCEIGTDGGQQATAATHQLLDGQSVRLTPGLNAPWGRYGRELQRVFVPATSIDYATAGRP